MCFNEVIIKKMYLVHRSNHAWLKGSNDGLHYQHSTIRGTLLYLCFKAWKYLKEIVEHCYMKEDKHTK